MTRIGEVAYELKLPEGTQVHQVFHVSQLKGRVNKEATVSPDIPLQYPQLNSKETPEGILDRRVVKKDNEPNYQILIKWKNRPEEEALWEDYEGVRTKFPNFILRDKENFEEERMSGKPFLRLGVVEEIDRVKLAEGEKGLEGQCGQTEVFNGQSLTGGPQGAGSDTKERGQVPLPDGTQGV